MTEQLILAMMSCIFKKRGDAMREFVSYLLLLFIVFFLVTAILDVKLGMIAIVFVIIWLVLIMSPRSDPTDNYLQLTIISGTYAALFLAILTSWTHKIREITFTDLSSSQKYELFWDIATLTLLICMGIMLITFSSLLRGKEHPYFRNSKRKRFVERHAELKGK